jgi:hypothetical protein
LITSLKLSLILQLCLLLKKLSLPIN